MLRFTKGSNQESYKERIIEIKNYYIEYNLIIYCFLI